MATNSFKRDKRGDFMDFPASTMAAMLKPMELEAGLVRTLSQYSSSENPVWLGLAKPYCNPLMFESGSPSQAPSVPTEKVDKESPMYYALLAFNLLTCLYENAYTGALGSTGRCSTFNVSQLREQVPVRYVDVPIGQDRQGSICLVRYSCSQVLRNWAWPRNQPIDPNSIELPPPLVEEKLTWSDELRARVRELFEQERDHESVFLKACLKVLATPPWELLDFILSPGDIKKVDPRCTVLSRPHWAKFLDRKANVARKMVAVYGLGSYIPSPGYVPGANEAPVQLKDIFSVPNALRLFYRYVSPYSRLFDSQDHPMTNEIMFVARFYLPWDQLPHETHLRQASELATLIREELQERQAFPDPERERQRIIGEDGPLLSKLRQCSDLILAEEKGRAEFVQGKPASDCIYLKWHQVAQRVAEAIHSGRFPDFQPFTSLFYLFDAHNFQNGDPSRMARGPLLETKFEHMRDERIFIKSETKREFQRATQNEQTFGEFQRKMARQVYPLLNLLNATHYEVPIDDGKKLYDRSSFFLLQAHPFAVRTKSADLSPKDDLLAVISDLLVHMGIVDARPEILRWVEFYLESPSAREDVRIILAMGGTGAGKTWFLNLLLRFMGEKAGSVSTSETDKAAFYAVSRLFFSQLLDEFARNSDKDKSKSGPDTSLRMAIALFMCHGSISLANNDRVSSAIKANTNAVRIRQIVAQANERIGGEYRLKELKSVVGTSDMATMNGNTLGWENALRERIARLVVPSQAQSRADGYFRAVWATDIDEHVKYVHQLSMAIYVGWHLFHAGYQPPELLSYHSLAASVWAQCAEQGVSAPAEKLFLAVNAEEKSRVAFVQASYAQFAENLRQAKSVRTSLESCRKARAVHEMEAKVRDFARQMSRGVELQGLRCGDGQSLCSSRGDDNVRNASQGSVLLSSVRSLFEFNAGGMCYGYYDAGWAYSHLFLPWVDKLAFVRGIEQGLEPLDPRTLFAASTVVALIMDWIHWRPDQIDFDSKNGYLKLRNFFGAKSASPQFQDLLHDPPAATASDFGAYVPPEEAKAVAESKQVKETASREKRVSKYNEECAKAFPAVLWTSQDMIDYRAFLSQVGSNDFVEGCPFVHYMPFLDPGSTPDLLVHCRIFGLFDFIKRQVSHLVSETASPLACLLTSGTTVGQETELDDGHTIVVRREPEALVLLDRHPDASRFHPQSIYHRSNLERFFGLVESQQREWLFRRRVFGVATEPLDEAKFYNERAEIEAMDRAALQEAAKRSGEGEPGHEQEQQQPLAARGLPVPMEEVEGESQDPADRLIALLAELPSLSLDSLEILQEFCTHSSAYQRENTRVGFNTVNPHRMNALRVFRTLVDISATPAMTSSFLAEVRKFIGLRTNSIAQTSLRQGKKVQPYYEWMERISQRVTLADLAQMGSLPTNDFGNQARAFPSLHWSARMEEEHLKVQSRGRMEIYSHTGAMVTSHLLNSYRLVDAEWDGWMARMLGADHYRRHFWHRRNVHLLRRHYGQVQDSLQWLARVFQFMACEVDLEDRLFYIDRNFPEQKDPQFRVYVPQLKAMLKKMLVAFFQLMLQFSRLSGLLAPFVSEAFCAFTAEKLGIRYCHRIVSQIPRFLHGFVFADLAQEEFTKVVEAWCDEVLVETEAQRKRRLAHFQGQHMNSVTANKLGDYVFYPDALDLAPVGEEALKRYSPALVLSTEQLRGLPALVSQPPALEHADVDDFAPPLVLVDMEAPVNQPAIVSLCQQVSAAYGRSGAQDPLYLDSLARRCVQHQVRIKNRQVLDFLLHHCSSSDTAESLSRLASTVLV